MCDIALNKLVAVTVIVLVVVGARVPTQLRNAAYATVPLLLFSIHPTVTYQHPCYPSSFVIRASL